MLFRSGDLDQRQFDAANMLAKLKRDADPQGRNEGALQTLDGAGADPHERAFRRAAAAARYRSARAALTVAAANSPSLRARAVVRLLRHFSPATLRPLLAALKVRGLSVYTDTHNHSSERSHRVLSSGHDLRAAVFGLNDGLVSNLSLMFGVAGANADDASVLLAGFAGLLAGSLSMASGEYVSVRAQRDLFDSQIALERAELEQYPEAEAGELATIFQARGMSPEIARQAADALIADPDHALLTLAREELGLEPSGLASPWRAAVASFLAFSLGAAIPLLPFGFASGSAAMFGGAVLASISLLLMGALVAMFSGRGILASGLRMLLIGLGAAGTTWLIGRALGVAIS
ncbi:MAG: hypothetical protein EBV57_07675 [Betaproteobacteria bacterium]|nr:hypothetical protein [Betaproteobacteria bacterium]